MFIYKNNDNNNNDNSSNNNHNDNPRRLSVRYSRPQTLHFGAEEAPAASCFWAGRYIIV